MDTNIAAGPQRLRNGGMAMRKIACLFPGIGYTCDKPLLYYSWKLLKGLDWEIVPVLYSGFPSGVKGNAEKMQQCAHMALEQAEDLLQEIDWSEYTEILLIGKSIGTVVCAAYAKRHRLDCRQILFTPVEAAFEFAGRRSIAFHGTADPWADTKAIEKCCRRLGIPLYETEDANHSLETGNVDADIKEMRKVMKTVREFVTKES
jgi:phosphoglycolate phosphatase